MVEKDYVMRIIHEMVRTILKLIFHIDEETEQELVFLDGDNQDFYQRLCRMADAGEINEAENMLCESLEAEAELPENEAMDKLKLALAFYDYLNTKSSDFLDDNDFSREEVGDGIKNVLNMYGYAGLAETLMETR